MESKVEEGLYLAIDIPHIRNLPAQDEAGRGWRTLENVLI